MNLQSMKRKAVPLHAEMAEVLRHQIMSGELPPGARLPALRELTKELGVSRMTVLQAMNTLEDEGLIEKHSGRGTFVRAVQIPDRVSLQMRAEISEIYAMVDQLEVSVRKGDATIEKSRDGRYFRCMRRIHARGGKPFCQADIQLDDQVYERAPDRFKQEIVVAVLRDLGVDIANARQKITIAYADFGLAKALGIKVNSAVFRVYREFFDKHGVLIYSAKLLYPCDKLEFEIEFSTGDPA
ncbi:MAG: GntR family transcriptional regulator [Paracoccaceae bacterium]|nr:GntR family transcriptional regulator [Paracoccaceae bacterium]MDE2914020.1 GntR family transcriptional regulator [Paracoccaceae bacterium]